MSGDLSARPDQGDQKLVRQKKEEREALMGPE